MRVLVVLGPNAGRVLDMCTRQAESAIAGGWAKLPAAEEIPAALPAEVQTSGEVEVARPAEPQAAPGPWPDAQEEPFAPLEEDGTEAPAEVQTSGKVEVASIEPREETADVTPAKKPRRGGR